ncbi:MAG: hypothetical protein E4G98_04355 [Promethearchaeota archaeon]|nr:MAG: hypothetical protein E4G98_04355 [Candidatus Lokiarchaeota archaeon]
MKPKKHFLGIILSTIMLLMLFSILIGNDTRQNISPSQKSYDDPPISARSKKTLLYNMSTERGDYKNGGKLLNLLLYTIENDTGTFYEFTYTLDAYVEDSTVPKPFGLAIQWVDNNSANFFFRYVNEPDSVNTHVYIEEKFVIKVSKTVGYYRVIIWYDKSGSIIHTHREGQYREFQNDDYIMPVLVTSPSHFNYIMNIYIRDRSESITYQISTEVIWSNFSDNIAEGTSYMTANTHIPPHSSLDKNVNITLRIEKWIKTGPHNSNGIYCRHVLKNSDQITSIPIEWSSSFSNGIPTGSIGSWTAYEVKYDRWFIHSYLIEFDFRTCQVELQFGELETPNSVPGFIGIYYFLLPALIALIIWRRKNITKKYIIRLSLFAAQ